MIDVRGLLRVFAPTFNRRRSRVNLKTYVRCVTETPNWHQPFTPMVDSTIEQTTRRPGEQRWKGQSYVLFYHLNGAMKL